MGDADLLSGEPSSRLIQQLDAQLTLLLLRLLTLLPDMDLSANKMDLLQLSSQKFSKMVIMILKFVPKFPRKFFLLSCNNFSPNISSLKVSCSNQIWSPQDNHAQIDPTLVKSLCILLELFQELSYQPFLVLFSFL